MRSAVKAYGLPIRRLSGGNLYVLLLEVLGSTCVIRNRGDGSSGFKVEFLVLSVCVSVVLSAVEQGLGEVVDVVFAYGVVSKNNRENGNGGGVSVHAAVGSSGDGCSCIVRRGFLKLGDVLSVHGYQVCLLGGGKVGDSGGGSASYDECCVNLAVLQGVGGVSEVLIYSGDVLLTSMP